MSFSHLRRWTPRRGMILRRPGTRDFPQAALQLIGLGVDKSRAVELATAVDYAASCLPASASRPSVREVTRYLRVELGVPHAGAKIGRMVEIDPAVLVTQPSEMARSVGYLRSKKICTNEADIVTLVTRHPCLLSSCVDSQLEPAGDFLQFSLSWSDIEFTNYIRRARNPEVLCLSVDRMLKPGLEYLRAEPLGLSNEQCAEILEKCNPLFRHGVEQKLEGVLQQLISHGRPPSGIFDLLMALAERGAFHRQQRFGKLREFDILLSKGAPTNKKQPA